MKLKTITIQVAAFLSCSLSAMTWANEDLEAVPASEEIQVLASINDATAGTMSPMELAANEVDTIEEPAEAATTEAAPAEGEDTVSEEVMQVCETAAQEEGVTEDAMDEFIQNCVDENSGTLAEDPESADNSSAEDMVEGEVVADEAGVADLNTQDQELAVEDEVVADEGTQAVADEGVDDPNAYVMTGSEMPEEVTQ